MLDVKRYRRVLVCVGEFEQTGGLAAVLIVYSELNRAVIERCSACNGYLIRSACEIEAVEFDNNVVAYLLNARAVYLVIIAVQIIVVCRRVFRIGTVVLFKLKAAEYAGIIDNKADVVRSAYSARQVEGLWVCSVPSAVILYCKCADISAAVVGIAEIQLYGIIFTAAAVSDAYRNLLGSAAEINGAEANGRSSVKAAERASVYRNNGNIREIAKAGGNKDIRILFCFSESFCRIFKLGDNLRNIGTVL